MAAPTRPGQSALDRPRRRLTVVGAASAAEEPFLAFHRAESSAAARYALVVLGGAGRSDLDDVLQEAWFRAWRAWTTVDVENRKAWLLRIVHNCCVDRHRRDRSHEPISAAEGPAVPPADATFLGQLECDEALSYLYCLPTGLRDTLWLRAVAELTYAEIADVLDIPIGTVMSRLQAARRKLATILRKEGR